MVEVSTKVCNKCNNIQSCDNFTKDRFKKDGLSTICKSCKRQYKIDNHDKIKEYKKAYRLNSENKQREIESRQLYLERNRLEIRKKERNYRKEQKELGLFKKHVPKKVYKRNLERARKAELYKRLFCVEYRIKKNLRIRLNKALKKGFKNCSAVKDLGISIEDFKTYLESKFYATMSWDNYGSYWVLDHIIPLASVDLNIPEEASRLCHYSNIQPLTIKHNSIKKDRQMTEHELELLKGDGGLY